MDERRLSGSGQCAVLLSGNKLYWSRRKSSFVSAWWTRTRYFLVWEEQFRSFEIISWEQAQKIIITVLGHQSSRLILLLVVRLQLKKLLLMDNKLRINGDFTFRNFDNNNNRRRVPVPYSTQQGVITYLSTSYNDYQKYFSNTLYTATNLYAEYEDTFADVHHGGNSRIRFLERHSSSSILISIIKEW